VSGGPQVWSVPAALGFLTLVGVVAALLSDGIGDAISWITLAIPVAVALWFIGRALRAGSGGRSDAGISGP